MNEVIDAVITLAYLLFFAVIAFTLRGIRHEIRRVVDRMEEPE